MSDHRDVKSTLVKDSVFVIGKVLSVDGRIVRIQVFKNKNSSHLFYDGALIKNVSVGSYIKIKKGFVNIIGRVEGEYIHEDKTFNSEYGKTEMRISRILQVSLYGHFDGGRFIQGIKEMPLLDNECFLLDKEEFNQLHRFYRNSEPTVRIGVLTEEPMQDIYFSIDKLFASHIGIFGNTGSGKSNTLAQLYTQLFSANDQKSSFQSSSKFVFIDFNGEYTTGEEVDCILTDKKQVYNLSTATVEGGDKLPLSEEDLLDVELLSIIANATDKTQRPFIRRAVNFYKHVHAESVSDPTVYFRNILKKRIEDVFQMALKDKSHTLIDYIKVILGVDDHESVQIPDWNNKNNHFMSPDSSVSRQISVDEIKETDLYKKVESYIFPQNSISKIIHFLYLQIIQDIYTDKAQNEHIAPAINKLKSKQKDIEKTLDTASTESFFPEDTNVIVVNFKDANSEVKKSLPLVLAKKLYDAHKVNHQDKSLHIVIDEAHNILSHVSERESQSWKDYRLETFEEMIKEGRKFGVFLTIASQRPQDISPTIISQLHNYFIHRLMNNNDIKAIERSIAYLDKLSFDTIPILSVGSCFVAGLASNIPIKVTISELPRNIQPTSQTIKLSRIWSE